MRRFSPHVPEHPKTREGGCRGYGRGVGKYGVGKSGWPNIYLIRPRCNVIQNASLRDYL